MKTKQINTLLAIAATSILGVNSSFAAVNLIINGDFETGDFTGWTNSSQSGSSGSRAIDTPGTATPFSGAPTAANALGGSFYAVTDQGGPGAYSLVQMFTITSAPSSVVLSFQMFNQTSAAQSINPAGFDYNFSPNQHARVDILTATAGLFSTAPVDVLQNFYIGKDASNPEPYTTYTFDITSLVSTPGNYQLRFGQVDNQGFFQQGVDNVRIDFQAIPEPSASLLAGVALLGLLRRRR